MQVVWHSITLFQHDMAFDDFYEDMTQVCGLLWKPCGVIGNWKIALCCTLLILQLFPNGFGNVRSFGNTARVQINQNSFSITGSPTWIQAECLGSQWVINKPPFLESIGHFWVVAAVAPLSSGSLTSSYGIDAHWLDKAREESPFGN